MSCTLLEGRMRAAAPISPVSSSTAKSTRSISCSGWASPSVMPQPWLTTAWMRAESSPRASMISRTLTQCSSG